MEVDTLPRPVVDTSYWKESWMNVCQILRVWMQIIRSLDVLAKMWLMLKQNEAGSGQLIPVALNSVAPSSATLRFQALLTALPLFVILRYSL